MSNSRSFGLDFMRALAISLVIIAHFAKTNEYFGFWGVEMFFGLSGFLIGQILWRNFYATNDWTKAHVLNFWSRRWWRTLPNYYLFVIVSIAFHHYYYNKLPSLLSFSKFLWFGQNLLVRNREFYGVSWSLCIEEWLYLLFPVILFIYSKIVKNKGMSFVLTLFTMFIGCALIREYLLHTDQADSIRTITFARIDAIAYGIGVAYFFIVRPSSTGIKALAFGVGFLLLLTPIFITLYTHTELNALRQNKYLLVLVPLGASLMLPLITKWHWPAGRFDFIAQAVEKISLWSYSIYLSHIPILFTVYSVMGSARNNFVGNVFSKVLGLAITLIVSALLFNYFELPLTRKRPHELK